MWKEIKEKLLNLMNDFVPTKQSTSRYNAPWINTEVKRITRQKKRAYNKARSSKKHRDIERYKRLKVAARLACKRAHNNYIKDIVSPDSQTNPKKFWSFIKSKRNDNSGVSPLKDPSSGITYSDSGKKADILNNKFSSVFNKDESSAIPDKGPSPHPSMNNIHVNEGGIRKLLSGLKPHKAAGCDGIPSRLLKELHVELAPILTLFFQASINQGTIPTDWKSANVVPIFKKGERHRPENYRPVSLTSITCKLLEHVICSNILGHLDKFNILTDAQHGFRKRRSCETQLILTVQDLAGNLDNRMQTDVILLDFSKAFDKVPH